MRSVGAGRAPRTQRPQVYRGPANTRRHRPVEVGFRHKVVIRAERTLETPGASGGGAKLRLPPFEKRRTEGHVLRPGDWPIAGIKILEGLAHQNRAVMEQNPAFESQLRDRELSLGPQFRTLRGDLVDDNRTFSVRRQA